jgi:hypothetical protein
MPIPDLFYSLRISLGDLLVQRWNARLKFAASLKPRASAMSSLARADVIQGKFEISVMRISQLDFGWRKSGTHDVAHQRYIPFSFSELSSDDRRDIDALKHVRPELLEAVAFAEKAAEGKAVGATLVDEDGTPNFAVVVVSNDRLKQVMLEARRDDRHASASRRPAGIRTSKN